MPPLHRTHLRKPPRTLVQGGLLLIGIVLFITTIQSPTKAEILSIEACQALADKRKVLREEEAVKAMQKGFEWVKANIKGNDLQPIKAYIEIEEQLKFRCPKKRQKTKRKTKTQPKQMVRISLPIKKPANADEKAPNIKPEPAKKPVRKTPVKAKPAKKNSHVTPPENQAITLLESFFGQETPPPSKPKKLQKQSKKPQKPVEVPKENPFFLD